ncbi:PDZ domain-containing protein [Fructilactobacillus florum]|uniref:PDZ domain-containing protein n=1 Tax=Fructilactobacillus florum DSM 22689 = JCM 16035 TaxID=1423745 RepID=A0A0R2CXK6_9LACO|nr:PDZ domain-containing protein [Fructilactobacillus florum]KRM92534.1 hypothetical protein FC87_GL000146 [Fructilactobacillus florum DSM 22689 = JCM 16035]
MQEIFNFGFFIISPLFWLGLLHTQYKYRQRVKRERHLYESAINPKNSEMRTFFIAMIVLGIVGSLCSLAVGVEVSYTWIVFYELLAVVALFLPGTTLPFLALFLPMIIVQLFGDKFYTLSFIGKKHMVLQNPLPEGIDFLALLTILLFLQYLFIKFNRKSVNSPVIGKNIRGNRVATYLFDKVSVVPLVLLVPGDLFETTSPFWPVFKIFGVKLSILIVPFLIGLNFRFIGEQPAKIMQRLANAIGWLALASLGITIDAFFWKSPLFEVLAIGCLAVVYCLIMYHFRKVDRKDQNQVEEALDGVRVLAVKPQTPASKMKLEIGDLIQVVNGIHVTDEQSLYRALQTSPTFCRLKIKNRRGDLELKESSIFAGGPHEIGIVTFPSDEK